VNGYTFLAAITAGRDLWGRWRASRQVPSPAPETGPEGSPLAPIRVSLALSAIVAIAVALSSDSVVTLWHHLGSVGTPVLLVPLLLAHGRFRVSGRLALASMLLSGALSLTWLVLGGATPFLGIEAIFPGLGLSLTIMGLGAFHGRGKVPAS
jgi:Na+/pantothenate symporter